MLNTPETGLCLFFTVVAFLLLCFAAGEGLRLAFGIKYFSATERVLLSCFTGYVLLPSLYGIWLCRGYSLHLAALPLLYLFLNCLKKQNYDKAGLPAGYADAAGSTGLNAKLSLRFIAGALGLLIFIFINSLLHVLYTDSMLIHYPHVDAQFYAHTLELIRHTHVESNFIGQVIGLVTDVRKASPYHYADIYATGIMAMPGILPEAMVYEVCTRTVSVFLAFLGMQYLIGRYFTAAAFSLLFCCAALTALMLCIKLSPAGANTWPGYADDIMLIMSLFALYALKASVLIMCFCIAFRLWLRSESYNLFIIPLFFVFIFNQPLGLIALATAAIPPILTFIKKRQTGIGTEVWLGLAIVAITCIVFFLPGVLPGGGRVAGSENTAIESTKVTASANPGGGLMERYFSGIHLGSAASEVFGSLNFISSVFGYLFPVFGLTALFLLPKKRLLAYTMFLLSLAHAADKLVFPGKTLHLLLTAASIALFVYAAILLRRQMNNPVMKSISAYMAFACLALLAIRPFLIQIFDGWQVTDFLLHVLPFLFPVMAVSDAENRESQNLASGEQGSLKLKQLTLWLCVLAGASFTRLYVMGNHKVPDSAFKRGTGIYPAFMDSHLSPDSLNTGLVFVEHNYNAYLFNDAEVGEFGLLRKEVIMLAASVTDKNIDSVPEIGRKMYAVNPVYIFKRMHPELAVNEVLPAFMRKAKARFVAVGHTYAMQQLHPEIYTLLEPKPIGSTLLFKIYMLKKQG
ncbi:MAG: hypothetical protein V4543_03695 [Bacteroidota bacterium]